MNKTLATRKVFLAVVTEADMVVAKLESVSEKALPMLRLKGADSKQARRLAGWLTTAGVAHTLDQHTVSVDFDAVISAGLNVTLRP